MATPKKTSLQLRRRILEARRHTLLARHALDEAIDFVETDASKALVIAVKALRSIANQPEAFVSTKNVQGLAKSALTAMGVPHTEAPRTPARKRPRGA